MHKRKISVHILTQIKLNLCSSLKETNLQIKAPLKSRICVGWDSPWIPGYRRRDRRGSKTGSKKRKKNIDRKTLKKGKNNAPSDHLITPGQAWVNDFSFLFFRYFSVPFLKTGTPQIVPFLPFLTWDGTERWNGKTGRSKLKWKFPHINYLSMPLTRRLHINMN